MERSPSMQLLTGLRFAKSGRQDRQAMENFFTYGPCLSGLQASTFLLQRTARTSLISMKIWKAYLSGNPSTMYKCWVLPFSLLLSIFLEGIAQFHVCPNKTVRKRWLSSLKGDKKGASKLNEVKELKLAYELFTHGNLR